MNTRIVKLACWLLLGALTQGTAAVAAEKYPLRPIRIIIGVQPGAGADFVARLVAQILSDRWGQNVVVDPRPGGGGVIASGLAAKAEPDGYTLYQNGFGLLLQGATKRVDFDVLKTFVPVVRMTSQPYILITVPNLPAKSVKELIAYSAKKPITYAGSSGVGSSVHLGMEQLAKLSGMKLKHIAYKGSSPAIRALMGGEINMVAASAMSATAAIKTGKVRALACLGLKRVPVLPDLPTVAEQGFPNFKIDNSYNLWVPTGTPSAVVDALNKAVSEGMNTPAMEKKLAASGSAPVDPISPKDLKAMVESEYADIQKSVKELGLKF